MTDDRGDAERDLPHLMLGQIPWRGEQHDGQSTLRRVQSKDQEEERPAHLPREIGRAQVARSNASQIDPAKETADQIGKWDRADQVGQDEAEQGWHYAA